MKLLMYLVPLFPLVLHGGPGNQIEIIEMNHRAAFEMVPLIKPLLPPGDAISASGNQLILRTNPDSLAEIQRLLAELDRPRRNLLVTVDHSGSSDAAFDGISGRASVGGRDAVVVVNDARRPGARLDISADEFCGDRSAAYQLRVLEGERALIESGETAFLPETTLVYGSDGISVREGVRARSSGSGFLVLPRISGERVTLTVEPYIQQTRSDNAELHSERINTVVSGTLGHWIPLGGVVQNRSEQASGVLSRSQETTGSTSRLRVKVEVLE